MEARTVGISFANLYRTVGQAIAWVEEETGLDLPDLLSTLSCSGGNSNSESRPIPLGTGTEPTITTQETAQILDDCINESSVDRRSVAAFFTNIDQTINTTASGTTPLSRRNIFWQAVASRIAAGQVSVVSVPAIFTNSQRAILQAGLFALFQNQTIVDSTANPLLRAMRGTPMVSYTINLPVTDAQIQAVITAVANLPEDENTRNCLLASETLLRHQLTQVNNLLQGNAYAQYTEPAGYANTQATMLPDYLAQPQNYIEQHCADVAALEHLNPTGGSRQPSSAVLTGDFQTITVPQNQSTPQAISLHLTLIGPAAQENQRENLRIAIYNGTSYEELSTNPTAYNYNATTNTSTVTLASRIPTSFFASATTREIRVVMTSHSETSLLSFPNGLQVTAGEVQAPVTPAPPVLIRHRPTPPGTNGSPRCTSFPPALQPAIRSQHRCR